MLSHCFPTTTGGLNVPTNSISNATTNGTGGGVQPALVWAPAGGGGGGSGGPKIQAPPADPQHEPSVVAPASTATTATTTTATATTTTATTTSSNNNNMSINRPIKLRNVINGEQTVDTLHLKYKNNNKAHSCNETRCLGSLMNPKPVEHRVRTPEETLEQAIDFINNYYASIKRLDSPAHKQRLKEIEEQIKSSDTYYLKETELIYGAKLAWRNAPRCIGRIQWSKLQVFDARFTKNETEMFEALCNHIKYATNKGSLRSAITILPQRVKSTSFDWRIWNSQLISYAGYRDKQSGKVLGDPINADFTEICQKLGWKGKGTRFDVLPLVLSANGGPPKMFPLPDELVLRVQLKHPKYKWFEELGLEWYALPAVSGMMLDLGGLQFTACPFSGWYMVTEIGTRDLGDTSRYNVLEEVAQRLGLNTSSNQSLWRDQAVVELNIAVLDSFQSAGVTIVDHHTASETFMTHLANEQRLRGGCPADWVWLVPPTAGSTTQVFHQEMVNYHLLPNYEYMEAPWKQFNWQDWERQRDEQRLKDLERSQQAAALKLGAITTGNEMAAAAAAVSPISLLKQLAASGGEPVGVKALGAAAAAAARKSSIDQLSPSSVVSSNGELTPRRLRFKEIARAVKFTSKLFGKALSRRIKATILYATETGKSERFASKLAQTFSCAFNVHLMSMSDYDMTCLEHEALLLIVTSTFGNGDPPENGEAFAKHIAAVKLTGDTSPDLDSINSVSTNPFFQMLSEEGASELANKSKAAAAAAEASTSPLINESDADNNNQKEQQQQQQQQVYKRIQEQQTNIRPLSNVRFSVFALGSTAYPHFCAFGRYVDQTLGELGAERIAKCTCGDELAGQEKVFNEWSSEVFKIACDVFCLTDSIGPIDARPEVVWSPSDVRFAPIELIDNEEAGANGTAQTMTPTSGTTTKFSITTVGQQRSFQQAQQRDLSFDQHRATIDLLNNNSISKDVNQKEQQQQQQPQLQAPVRSSSEILSNKKTIVQNLMSITSKKIVPFTVVARKDLHCFIPEENLQTLNIDLDCDLVAGPCLQATASAARTQSNKLLKFNLKAPPILFEPGDHVGIYPTNKHEVVDRILARIQRDLPPTGNKTNKSDTDQNNNNNNIELTPTNNSRRLAPPAQQLPTSPAPNSIDFDQVYRVLVRRENMDLTPAASDPLNSGGGGAGGGSGRSEADNWISYDRLPITSIREALTRYLDITNPPNQEFLATLSRLTSDLEEKKRLQQMARNFKVYEEWKNKNVPTLLSTLDEFKHIRFDPALITQMPLMKPRFYSISGTNISLTLGVVRFKTASGDLREGLCSNYLNEVPLGPRSYIYGYVRSAPAFHMPQNKAVPMILIGAGTGIAPFRSFWKKRYTDVYGYTTTTTTNNQSTTRQQNGNNNNNSATPIILTNQHRDGIHLQTNGSLDSNELSKSSAIRSPNGFVYGRIELYFGCRNSNYILYKDELDQMYESGILSSINIAFSRPIDRDIITTTNAQENSPANISQTTPPSSVSTISSSSSSPVPQSSPNRPNYQQVGPNSPPTRRSKVETIKQARKKVYVQDKLFENSAEVYKLIMLDEAHVYVCGDVAMADGVYKTLAKILSKQSSEDGESTLMNLRNLNRYHEDIFGAKQMS